MYFKKVLLCSTLLCGSYLSLNAQSFIPPNMDFELGTTANWTYYRGTVAMNHIFTLSSSGAVTGLHTLMSGSGTDPYGGFPVVGGGMYSLKLAHDTSDNNADAASYNIHVPATGSYRLDYKYAAALQGVTHASSEQPVMKVTAIDSATGVRLSDSLYILPSSPGFTLSTTMGTDIYYKAWTAASINLLGYSGRTVTVKFAVAACGTGAHFGYGYIDVTTVAITAATAAPLASMGNGAINVYPNPASSVLHIQWASQRVGSAQLALTDMTGRVVNSAVINMTKAGETQLSTEGLSNGLYLLTIKAGEVNYNSKIVIQK